MTTFVPKSSHFHLNSLLDSSSSCRREYDPMLPMGMSPPDMVPLPRSPPRTAHRPKKPPPRHPRCARARCVACRRVANSNGGPGGSKVWYRQPALLARYTRVTSADQNSSSAGLGPDIDDASCPVSSVQDPSQQLCRRLRRVDPRYFNSFLSHGIARRPHHLRLSMRDEQYQYHTRRLGKDSVRCVPFSLAPVRAAR